MKRSAFSLIELVVVIAIIALLTTIAIPYYGNYVTRSRVALAAMVLTELNSKAMALYNEGKITPGMTSLVMDGVTWNDDSTMPYDRYPVNSASMLFPGDGYINDNAWMFCVYVSDLNYSGYTGTQGSRLCSKVVVDDGIFKTYCGAWDQGSALEVPLEFLPDECNVANVSAY